MSSIVAPQKLCTLTIHPFLLNRSYVISFKMEPPIMSAVLSGYFPCVSPLLFVAIGSQFLLPEFLNSQNFSFFFNHFFKLVLHRFFEYIIYVFFVGNKNFVIGICNFIIVVTSIFNTLLNCFLVLS